MLVHGLPPEAAVWRRKELPPVERLGNEQARLVHQWAETILRWMSGKPVTLPDPPVQFEAVDEQPRRPSNVVSIAEFAKRNSAYVREGVSHADTGSRNRSRRG